MKNFIIKSIILLSLIIITTYFSNKTYEKYIINNSVIFKTENQWIEYKNKLENNTLDYAFFGDSHCRDNVNPIFINKNSFNFCESSENYIETYFKIKKIIEVDKIKINNLVLQLDSHKFSQKLNNNIFKDIEYYSKFVPLNIISDIRDEKYLATWLKTKILILGKGENIFSYLLKPNEESIIERGWYCNKKNCYKNFSLFQSSTRNLLTKARYNIHFDTTPNHIDNISLEYLQKILTLAKKENINLLLLSYPVSQNYEDQLLNENFNRKNFYNYIFSVLKKNQLNYKYYDFHDIYFDNDEYFRDSDHLNILGSKNFSKLINKEIVNK